MAFWVPGNNPNCPPGLRSVGRATGPLKQDAPYQYWQGPGADLYVPIDITVTNAARPATKSHGVSPHTCHRRRRERSSYASELTPCYTAELTAALTAGLAAEDLEALVAPNSMRSLVDETTQVPFDLADIELEAKCEPPMTMPNDSETCNQVLESRMNAYRSLRSTLDKWRPYM